jgi:hypothetical protein
MSWTHVRYAGGAGRSPAIAGHLGEDRRTIRAHLNGEWTTGGRAPAGRDADEPFVAYRQGLRQRRAVGAA